MLAVSSNWCRCHQVKLLWLQYKWSGSLSASDRKAAAIAPAFISKACKTFTLYHRLPRARVVSLRSFISWRRPSAAAQSAVNGRWVSLIKSRAVWKALMRLQCATISQEHLCVDFLSMINTLHSSFVCLLSAGAASLSPLHRHPQTVVSLRKSSMRSGPAKSCATLTQWPTACFDLALSSHPRFDGKHPLVSVPVSPCGWTRRSLLRSAHIPVLFFGNCV